MKDHKRQQKIVVKLPENSHHHGGAYGQALFGTAKDDGDAVLSAESQSFAAAIGGQECKAQNNPTYQNQRGELQGAQLRPLPTDRCP